MLIAWVGVWAPNILSYWGDLGLQVVCLVLVMLHGVLRGSMCRFSVKFSGSFKGHAFLIANCEHFLLSDGFTQS